MWQIHSQWGGGAENQPQISLLFNIRSIFTHFYVKDKLIVLFHFVFANILNTRFLPSPKSF